jgi:hypothetical protein
MDTGVVQRFKCITGLVQVYTCTKVVQEYIVTGLVQSYKSNTVYRSTGVLLGTGVAQEFRCSTGILGSRSTTGVQVYRSSTVLQWYKFCTGLQLYRSSTEVKWVQEYYRGTGVVQDYRYSLACRHVGVPQEYSSYT